MHNCSFSSYGRYFNLELKETLNTDKTIVISKTKAFILRVFTIIHTDVKGNSDIVLTTAKMVNF